MKGVQVHVESAQEKSLLVHFSSREISQEKSCPTFEILRILIPFHYWSHDFKNAYMINGHLLFEAQIYA